MNDEQRLIQAVIDDPEPDGPRLAYAAWLERAGADPRAECIRAQVEVRNRRHNQDPPESWLALADRAWELVGRHGDAWAAPIRPRVRRAGIRRGFVEEIEIDARTFLDGADDLLALAPIRHLVLVDAKPVLDELLGSRHLARLASLDLEGNRIGDRGAELIGKSQYLHRLRWLDLSRNEIGLPGLEALAASQQLPALRWLGFVGNLVEDPTGGPSAVESDGSIQDYRMPPLGEELQSRHGKRAWLCYGTWHTIYFPPDKDDV